MRYIYPPRPKDTIPPSALALQEERGCWFWQPKYDGDRSITAIEGKNIVFGNRHHKWYPHQKLRHLVPEVRALDLPSGATYLDGELLTLPGKAPCGSPYHTIVFYDVLQYDGKYLFGCPQLERLELLRKICRNPQKLCAQKVAWEIGVDRPVDFTPHLWMSLSGENDFLGNFQTFSQSSLVEGLLLRRKDSTLDGWGGTEYDVTWQLRCRKNTKNYRF